MNPNITNTMVCRLDILHFPLLQALLAHTVCPRRWGWQRPQGVAKGTLN